jgi:ABC-type Zn uptake system ZnuABC Zn-binding protein ZnuA
MIADMAKSIGGDHVNIDMIVPIGGDPHLHEPTPDNARLVTEANLILINGLTFEGWINELIENSGTKARTVTVTEGVRVLTSQTYQNSADPHAWMDAANGIIYSRNIKDALIALDPANEKAYQANYLSYVEQLSILDQEILRAIQTIPEEKRVLITSHDAFQYYGNKYGITLEAIMGISTEAEAQTSDIIRVNKAIREQQIPAIFVESTINPKLIEQLAHDNGISIGGKLYADSLGDKDSPASSYIDMLRYNTQTIVNALNQEVSTTANHDHSHGQGGESQRSYIWILAGVMLLSLGLLIYRLNR